MSDKELREAMSSMSVDEFAKLIEERPINEVRDIADRSQQILRDKAQAALELHKQAEAQLRHDAGLRRLPAAKIPGKPRRKKAQAADAAK